MSSSKFEGNRKATKPGAVSDKTCNLLPATCNPQPTLSNQQPVTSTLQPVTHNIYHKIVSKFTIFLCLLSVFSCSDEIEERPESLLGYDYFPLEVGRFWEYQVDSTIYDNNGTLILNSSSQIREEITDQFEGSEGDETYIIERSWRSGENRPWEVVNIWSAQFHSTQAIRTEDNLRFIKMVFPPSLGVVWDGNSFIDPFIAIDVAGESVEVYKNWEYKVIKEMDSEEIHGSSYENVITIQQADDENLIELRHSIEKYARNIGLVYKEMRILDTQCIELCAAESWEEKAEKGYILSQKLMNHN